MSIIGSGLPSTFEPFQQQRYQERHSDYGQLSEDRTCPGNYVRPIGPKHYLFFGRCLLDP